MFFFATILKTSLKYVLSQKRVKRRGYLPWLDELNLRPGMSWQTEIENRIETIQSAAVIVGSSGIGPWQRDEIEALLHAFLKSHRPVIPVILPSCKETPKLPAFLGNRNADSLAYYEVIARYRQEVYG